MGAAGPSVGDQEEKVWVALALAALLPAHLDRQWLPLLTAMDAAPEFGFGASVCAMEP